MKLLIAVSALVAAALAKPSGVATLAYAAAPVVTPVAIAPVASQFHVQDTLGQYSYGYSNALSAKSEARSADGVTVGGYKFIDGAGKLQSVEYSSDASGIRIAASNLPVPPAIPQVPALPHPEPVQDTPEVVEARAKHLAAVEEVKARSAEGIAPLAVSTLTIQPAIPVVPAAPVVALKSAPAETTEGSTTAAPVAETKSVTSAPETSSTPAPAVQLRSAVVPAATLNTVLTPAVAVAPSLSVRTVPAVGAPLAFGYSINGLSSTIVQPAITAYTIPFGAPLLAAHLTTADANTEAPKEAKESSD